MLGPLVFRLPVLSGASCSWLERYATNSSTIFRSSNVRGHRSSSLAFMLSRNTFAFWAILLCGAISRFADFNILTALLPVSHTVFSVCIKHQACSIDFGYHHDGLQFLHTLLLGFVYLFFLQAEQRVFFAGGQEHGFTICHCNTHEAWNIRNCSQFQSSSHLTKMNT